MATEKDNSKQDTYKANNQSQRKRKLSFNEQREFKLLESEIEQLESEKKALESALSGEVVSPDIINELSIRLSLINKELDIKSDRWLYLSDLVE